MHEQLSRQQHDRVGALQQLGEPAAQLSLGKLLILYLVLVEASLVLIRWFISS